METESFKPCGKKYWANYADGRTKLFIEEERTIVSEKLSEEEQWKINYFKSVNHIVKCQNGYLFHDDAVILCPCRIEFKKKFYSKTQETNEKGL